MKFSNNQMKNRAIEIARNNYPKCKKITVTKVDNDNQEVELVIISKENVKCEITYNFMEVER